MKNNKLSLAILLLAAYTSFASADITDVIDKTYDFNDKGRISLSNVNGNVSIIGCDCQQVHLIATIAASDQQTRDRISVKINASESKLSIKTKYAEQESGHHRNKHSKVVYSLSVPNHVELDQIELVNGDLTISGITGKLDAELVNGELKSDGMTSNTEVSLVNGDMQLTFGNLSNAKKIKLESVNGNIVVKLPSDANVSVSAETVSGKISNDFGLTVNEGRYVGSDMRGSIGDGSVRLDIENVNGRIQLNSL
jgi:DUF4097 and DUF4098 domain-containing protein YvlB